MKYILLVISIVYSLNCYGQDPDPDLFQTWHLIFVQASDMDEPYTVSEIDPPIAPFITIMEDLTFNGEGACNSFNGKFAAASPFDWYTSEFFETGDDCGIQLHNSFEDSYFFHMQSGGWYEITPEGDGLQLRMYNAIFGIVIFNNFPLNTTDFDFSSIKTYPNPSNSLIFIESGTAIITKVELFNSHGQGVKTLTNGFEEINITDLSSGFYIMRIFTESGSTNRKIVKE